LFCHHETAQADAETTIAGEKFRPKQQLTTTSIIRRAKVKIPGQVAANTLLIHIIRFNQFYDHGVNIFTALHMKTMIAN